MVDIGWDRKIQPGKKGADFKALSFINGYILIIILKPEKGKEVLSEPTLNVIVLVT